MALLYFAAVLSGLRIRPPSTWKVGQKQWSLTVGRGYELGSESPAVPSPGLIGHAPWNSSYRNSRNSAPGRSARTLGRTMSFWL